jgi:hypothetical protein
VIPLDLIRIIILAVLFAGLIWVSLIVANIRFQKGSARIGYKLRKKMMDFKYRDYRLIRHLDRLMLLAAPRYQPVESALRFCLFMLFSVVAVFVVMIMTHIPWKTSAAGAVTLGLGLPYLALRIRFAERSVRASYDLAEIVKLLSRHAHLPIHTALKRTAEDLSERNVLKRSVWILADAFSSYGSIAELQSEALRFSGAVGTTFATQLVMELMQAEKEGSKQLGASLKFLNSAIEEQKNTVLNVKKENRDAIALGMWVNLVVIVILAWSTASFLTWDVFFRLLTQTQIGVMLSLFVIGSFFVAFMVGRLLSRPKLDY